MKGTHKWWHFIYGKELKCQVEKEDGFIKTKGFYYVCKHCEIQIGNLFN